MPSSTFFTSVAFTSDDHLIAVGGRYATPAYVEGLVVKYNNTGTIVAQRLLSNGILNVQCNSVKVLPSGNILVSIYDDSGDTIMTLDPTLQTILWSRNLGLPSSTQTILVDGNDVYINSSTHIAKVAIGGDVAWVTGKTDSYTDIAIDPVSGNLVVISSPPSGAVATTDRTLWVYTLSSTTGAYISGTSIEFDGVTTDNPVSFTSILPVTDGYILSASGSSTTLVHINNALTTLTWAKYIATGFGSMALREVGADVYIGGRQFNQHKLNAMKITTTGNITWQKQFSVPSNTLDTWWNQGRDMMDVTAQHVALCGWMEDTTTPIFTQRQSAVQAVITSFINDSAFTYNTSTDSTHVVNSTFTSTPITASVIFTPEADTFFGIVPLVAA